MKHRIIFDKYNSTTGYENHEYSLMFLRSKIQYFEEVLKYRGYIYLNQIYECLGVAWNPKCENPYFESSCITIKFEVKDMVDDFEIIITW